ncbi:MAG: tail fiber domain-containing protein, partial [Bacteroidetes bacterium]|nr:tail fiber domain-containing protein [Bacteroidota bacterium]
IGSFSCFILLEYGQNLCFVESCFVHRFKIRPKSLILNCTNSGEAYRSRPGGITIATGDRVTTGSNNSFVGYLANVSVGGGALTNATAIGAFAEVAESNAIVLGSINGVNTATASTNVGIGTTGPMQPGDNSQFGAGGTVLNLSARNGGVRPLFIIDNKAAAPVAGTASGYIAWAISGYNAAWNTYIASIGTVVEGTTTANDYGGALRFMTKNDGGTNQERMRIMNSGNVGIGTTVPGSKLTVSTATSLDGVYFTDGTRFMNIMPGTVWAGAYNPLTQANDNAVIFSGGNLLLAPWSGSAFGVKITTGGLVGINRLPVTNVLEVNGDASKTTATAWLANSDRRIKTDIQDIDNALGIIMKLHPVKFKYTDEWKRRNPFIAANDHYYYNYIAQEYKEVFPESVKGSGEFLESDIAHSDEILQMDSYNTQIVAIKAIQELNEKNKDQQKQIDELKTLVEKLVKQNDVVTVPQFFPSSGIVGDNTNANKEKTFVNDLGETPSQYKVPAAVINNSSEKIQTPAPGFSPAPAEKNKLPK